MTNIWLESLEDPKEEIEVISLYRDDDFIYWIAKIKPYLYRAEQYRIDKRTKNIEKLIGWVSEGSSYHELDSWKREEKIKKAINIPENHALYCDDYIYWVDGVEQLRCEVNYECLEICRGWENSSLTEEYLPEEVSKLIMGNNSLPYL